MGKNNEQGGDGQALQAGWGQAGTAEKQGKARGASIGEVKGRTAHSSSPFRPKATLLMDIAPVESTKGAGTDAAGRPSEPDEGLLRELLMTTEASAARTEQARRRWQLLALIATMLLMPAVLAVGWLYVEHNQLRTDQGRVQMENQTLREQLNLASTQAAGLRGEIDIVVSRNIELAKENAASKAQNTTQVATPAVGTVAGKKEDAGRQQLESSTAPAPSEMLDANRMEAIRKGAYPSGTTKAELVAALGEPNRIYKSDKYEQLVYFGRSPGRFWFAGERLQHATK